MLGAAAKRIVHPIRKPRNNADEAIAAKPGWDGACRAICCVAPLANGAYHWLRVASCISSRRASVAATRDLCRGSLAAPQHRFGDPGHRRARTGEMLHAIDLRRPLETDHELA